MRAMRDLTAQRWSRAGIAVGIMALVVAPILWVTALSRATGVGLALGAAFVLGFAVILPVLPPRGRWPVLIPVLVLLGAVVALCVAVWIDAALKPHTGVQAVGFAANQTASEQGLSIGTDSASPEALLADYSIVSSRFLEPDPGSWGGAFADGDVLVVLAYGRSVRQSARLLEAAGVSGAVQVRRAQRSMAQLDELVDKVLSFGSPALVSVGPHYASSTVALTLSRDDAALLDYLNTIDPDAFDVQMGPAARLASWFRALTD